MIMTLKQENTLLRHQNETLRTQHKLLTKKTLTQVQSAAIQKVTNTTLRQQLNALQNNIIELDKELDFYHNITQGSTTSKLQVRELQLVADDAKSGLYRYRLVVSQGKKITEPIMGQLNIAIIGQVNDKSETIKLEKQPLKLRHVQVFHGQLALVKNMEPRSIKITLTKKNKTILSHTIDWKVAISATLLER